MVAPLLILQARAGARAVLYREGWYSDIGFAVAPLLKYALDSGIVDDIGAERAFAIIKTEFAGAGVSEL